MPTDDEALIGERLRGRLLDAEPSTASNALAITAAGRRRLRRRAGFVYGCAVTTTVAVISIGTAISQFTSGSTAQAPTAQQPRSTSAARDPSACPSTTMPRIKPLADPDLSVPGAPSVESALKLLSLPEKTLRTAVRRPLGQPKNSPVWVITAGSTYLVQQYRAGEGWYAEPAAFYGCQPVSSAVSPRPTPTSSTQPPPAAEARHDALVAQLQTNRSIRKDFFLGLDLGTRTVLCGLDILGDDGDTLYAWVECGAYTTGHSAAEKSGSALPVAIRVEGSGARTTVIGVDAPRESHGDAALARLFPPDVVTAIKSRAFNPRPDERSRLAAAHADS